MVAKFFHDTLDTAIGPMVYIMMGTSIAIGFFFATGLFMGDERSVLYSVGVLFPRGIWGAVLFFTALIAEIGFVTHNTKLIHFGGITGFMAWLFACIALFMTSQWYVLLTVGLLHLLFHGYVVLAVSLGYLYRRV